MCAAGMVGCDQIVTLVGWGAERQTADKNKPRNDRYVAQLAAEIVNSALRPEECGTQTGPLKKKLRIWRGNAPRLLLFCDIPELG